MSNTKMKGLLKGLRYISQIFDEEKEQEIQIGFPTDVKHVAHIGWDGPSAAAVDSGPSWMKEFKAPGGQFQSAPLNGTTGNPRENPEIKWVSEDSISRRSTRSEAGEPASIQDLPEVPRSRRHASTENPLGEGSTKSRHSSRRQQNKGSSESSKSSRQGKADSSGAPPESPSKKNDLPDIPKKSRRKKSKESVNGGSTRSSRSKANNDSAATTTYQSPFSDPGTTDIGYEYGSRSNKELPSLKPFLEEEGKGREVVH